MTVRFDNNHSRFLSKTVRASVMMVPAEAVAAEAPPAAA